MQTVFRRAASREKSNPPFDAELRSGSGTHFVADALGQEGLHSSLAAGAITTRSSHMNGRRLKHGVWVVVADGEKALFLRNEGDAQYPNLQVVRTIHEDNPPTREQGTDR